MIASMTDTVGTRPAAPRRYLQSHEREAQIVERAIELFALKGFAVSTRDIAAHCGVTQPLLYRYFPNKQALIDRIYREVYLSRWNPEWETLIRDRSRPIRDRLVAYFESYTEAITANEWVRIFMFGAMEEPQINQRYLSMLHDRILCPILEEVRADLGLPPPSPERQAIELEVVWALHSSFFYIGVRRWIYRLPVPADMPTVVDTRVRAFLAGMRAIAVA
jgi:AcrR family transcriptional regulator